MQVSRVLSLLISCSPVLLLLSQTGVASADLGQHETAEDFFAQAEQYVTAPRLGAVRPLR